MLDPVDPLDLHTDQNRVARSKVAHGQGVKKRATHLPTLTQPVAPGSPTLPL